MNKEIAVSIFSLINGCVLGFSIILGLYLSFGNNRIGNIKNFQMPELSIKDFAFQSSGDLESLFIIFVFFMLFLLFNNLYGAMHIEQDEIFKKEKDPSVKFCLHRILINYLSLCSAYRKDHRLARSTRFNLFRIHHIVRVLMAIIFGVSADLFFGIIFATPSILFLVIIYIFLLELYDIGETPSSKEILKL